MDNPYHFLNNLHPPHKVYVSPGVLHGGHQSFQTQSPQNLSFNFNTQYLPPPQLCHAGPAGSSLESVPLTKHAMGYQIPGHDAGHQLVRQFNSYSPADPQIFEKARQEIQKQSGDQHEQILKQLDSDYEKTQDWHEQTSEQLENLRTMVAQLISKDESLRSGASDLAPEILSKLCTIETETSQLRCQLESLEAGPRENPRSIESHTRAGSRGPNTLCRSGRLSSKIDKGRQNLDYETAESEAEAPTRLPVVDSLHTSRRKRRLRHH
jgi:hypothetical protein